MNKEQLTVLLAKHTGVSKVAAAKNLDAVTKCIKHARQNAYYRFFKEYTEIL